MHGEITSAMHIRNKWRRHRALASHPKARRMLPRTSTFHRRSLESYVDRFANSYVKPVGGCGVPFLWALRRSGATSQGQAQRLHNRLKRDSIQIARHFQKQYPHVRRLGIDHAVDTKGRPWLLEVNTSPGYELFKKQRNKQLVAKIERMLEIVRRRQK